MANELETLKENANQRTETTPAFGTGVGTQTGGDSNLFGGGNPFGGATGGNTNPFGM